MLAPMLKILQLIFSKESVPSLYENQSSKDVQTKIWRVLFHKFGERESEPFTWSFLQECRRIQTCISKRVPQEILQPMPAKTLKSMPKLEPAELKKVGKMSFPKGHLQNVGRVFFSGQCRPKVQGRFAYSEKQSQQP